jgi:hypothetical protein
LAAKEKTMRWKAKDFKKGMTRLRKIYPEPTTLQVVLRTPPTVAETTFLSRIPNIQTVVEPRADESLVYKIMKPSEEYTSD